MAKAVVIEQMFSPREAAKRLDMSVDLLRRMRVEKRGPRYKKRGTAQQARILYPASAIAEYLNQMQDVQTTDSKVA
jgi:hypothetical protein